MVSMSVREMRDKYRGNSHYNSADHLQLAPGGPVGYWRNKRNHSYGMDNQYQYNERQMLLSPRRQPSPLMPLRQPMFHPHRRSPPLEVQIPPLQLRRSSLHQLTPQGELFSPMQELRQPSLRRITPREETPPPMNHPEPKLRLPWSPEQIPPMKELRHASPEQRQFSPRQPPPPRPPSPRLMPPPRQPPPRRPPPRRPPSRQPPPPRQPSPRRPPSRQPPPRRQPSPLHWTDPESKEQIIEDEMQTDNSNSANKTSDDTNYDYTSGGANGAKMKKKVSNREWRRRQNLHLRRILTPKNALIVLNEMLPGEKGIGQCKVEPAPRHPRDPAPNAHTFCAELTVDGVRYKGYGLSKLAARTDAAEQVFRDLILKHMGKLQRACDASTGGFDGEEDREGEESEEKDETLPMIQLASFALHKLFAEWECDGHKVPQLKAPALPQVTEECAPSETIPRPPKPQRALPANAATMHPCMLLTHMKPDLQYRELDSPPGDSALYTMAIDVDGRTYVGSALNKKEARKAAARAACTRHFGVKFADEDV